MAGLRLLAVLSGTFTGLVIWMALIFTGLAPAFAQSQVDIGTDTPTYEEEAPYTVPGFSGQTLTGVDVEQDYLMGRPAAIIIAPTWEASEQLSNWYDALEAQMDDLRIISLLVVSDSGKNTNQGEFSRAKELIPRRLWATVWLVSKGKITERLDIPKKSDEPFVLVIGSEGEIISEVAGLATRENVSQVTQTLRSATIAP